jgi:uncharacterized membrane protein
MIIMALDHTRDFFHSTALTDDPLNLQTTTPLLFATRWITHLCAPVFVFLSGTSAYFQSLRKSKSELSSFLMMRGLWLIAVELLIVTLGITFNIFYDHIILQVIWAIGISMVLLSIVVWFSFPVILAIGLIIVLGHNLLDYWEADHQGPFSLWYHFLHLPTNYALPANKNLIVFYPFLPWTGVMILGYCFGKYYLADPINRHRRAILLGAGLVAAFIILRYFRIYGDPLPWAEQKNLLFTFFSFINTQKYPPSLLYLCMTIGPCLIILGLIGEARNKFTEAITVYGRVPLFYYVLHFYLIHLVSSFFYFSRGHSFEEGMQGLPGLPFKFVSPSEGYGLGVVYLVWISVVLLLYPICKWFANFKMRHTHWWLSYL